MYCYCTIISWTECSFEFLSMWRCEALYAFRQGQQVGSRVLGSRDTRHRQGLPRDVYIGARWKWRISACQYMGYVHDNRDDGFAMFKKRQIRVFRLSIAFPHYIVKIKPLPSTYWPSLTYPSSSQTTRNMLLLLPLVIHGDLERQTLLRSNKPLRSRM